MATDIVFERQSKAAISHHNSKQLQKATMIMAKQRGCS
ncbi:hypothetical protein COLO4_06760 [Corchorus olitorius]|uniref:Uncharacterized protein n=1 Tax=Corchorus olitorius TaxID=93759 RepID=A0A1R3KM23_9ROSI|nr:hypothetical protein COLO4_06760 [Corchorus olitorius]